MFENVNVCYVSCLILLWGVVFVNRLISYVILNNTILFDTKPDFFLIFGIGLSSIVLSKKTFKEPHVKKNTFKWFDLFVQAGLTKKHM